MLSNCTATFKLNNGLTIPAIGLGTWKATDPQEAINAVYQAIKNGYRQIDTAYIYRNEVEVGKGIKQAIDEGLVEREELFITTKLWGFDHDHPLEALKDSLSRLGLDYVDLYLMHWPIPLYKTKDSEGNWVFYSKPDDPNKARLFRKDWDFFKTWELMEQLPSTGLTKSIGVSNFNAGRLKALCEKAKIPPAINQVQLQPILPQFELAEVAKNYGVILQAYSPLGSQNAPLLENKTIKSIAEKNDIPPANVIFSWIVGRGIVVLPKSVKESRIINNLKIADLPKEDFQTLNDYAKNHGGEKLLVQSAWLPDGFWDEYTN